MVFQGCLKEFFKKFQLSRVLQKVSRVFHKNFKSILSKIERYFKGVFSGFYGHLKEFQREFQGSFKSVSR